MNNKRLIFCFFLFLFFSLVGTLFIFQNIGYSKNLYHFFLNFQAVHPILFPILFIVFYIIYAFLSLPGIFILSLIAGGLFVQPFSTLYVVVASTIGATLLYLASKTTLSNFYSQKKDLSTFDVMKTGFLRNSTSYILFLRFIPFFPFWMVNLAGGLFEVPIWTFIWTTFIGMIPSVYIYAQAGHSLFNLINHSEKFEIKNLYDSNMLETLGALAFLSLLPVLFKYFYIPKKTKEEN